MVRILRLRCRSRSRRFIKSSTLPTCRCTCTRICIFLFVFFTATFYFKGDSWRRMVFNSKPVYMDMVASNQNKKLIFNSTNVCMNGCVLPDVPIDNPAMMKLLHHVDPIVCSEDDWIVSNGTHGVVNRRAYIWTKYYKKFKCQFEEIIRQDGDFHVTRTKLGQIEIKPETEIDAMFEFKNSDFIYAECVVSLYYLKIMTLFGYDSDMTWNQTWASVLTGIRSNIDVPKIVPENNARKLNVLIWGVDSISRNMCQRKLPKTWKYLNENLGGVVLKGYNIVGDGTPQALIPILTGSTELELPEVRKSKNPNSDFVNVYPFIWNRYKNEHGYLTGYNEDAPHMGTFTYRLNGFKEIPTDFYMRSFFMDKSLGIYDYKCIGSMTYHGKMIDYSEQILKSHPKVPKFLFSFLGIGHNDVNNVQSADQDFVDFFQRLKFQNILNESIMIFMADHGQRFASSRNSQQGKLEERMPVFIFIFPSWFQNSYPTAYANFLINSERLTTPFDIHETLVDIPRLAQLDDEYFSQKNSLKFRGLSLFREVPQERNCPEARIDDHWCACLQWTVLDINLPIVQQAGEEFVKFLNLILSSYTKICSKLTLSSILWAAKFTPNENLLKFRQSSDSDGRVPEFNKNSTLSIVKMQLKLVTKPGDGLFETSFEYDLTTSKSKFHFKESVISRISRYRDQAQCVEKDANLEFLRKFCYCLTD